MQQLCTLTYVLGLMLVIFGLTYVLPIMTALIYEDGTAYHFFLGMALNIGIGLLMVIFTRRHKTELKTRDGYLLVSIFWVMMAGVATLPLLLTIPGLSFTDAYFETMSALTTTGATVLVGLDHLQQGANMWRHELNFIGGLGIIVLTVAILPLLGVGGMQLYKAESTGPIKDSKLTPRISETARLLWLVYVGLTIACIMSLKLVGMDWFDAICHAFAALSLGGLSTHDASIGYFDSPAIEIVLIIFMLLAAINFATHYLAWYRGSIRVYWQEDVEAVPMLVLILGSCVLGSWYMWQYSAIYPDFWSNLRHVSFNLVSIATDCGFASQDFDKWPPFVSYWILVLSSLCACTGSTGGGIKMFRTLVLWKQSGREMLNLLHPRVVSPLKIGRMVIANKVVFSVLAFVFLYFTSVVVLVFSLLASGLDFTTSFSAIIATINNAGPGLAQVGPASNYQGLTDFQTWICSLSMLLGRLELFTFMVLFTPAFWRK